MKISTILPLIILLACNLLWVGCVIPAASNKTESGLSLPKEWESKIQHADKNASQGWAKELGGEELRYIIKTAWDTNQDMRALSEQLIAQGEEATILGSQLLPNAGFEVTGSRSKRNLIGFNLPNGSTSFTSNSFTSGLNISWELDLWGKIANARDSASYNFEAGTLEYTSSRLSLAGQSAKTWYDLIEGSQQLRLARKTAQSFSQNQVFVQQRYEKGLANALERNLAEAGTATAHAQSLFLSGQLDMRKRKINQLLGRYPSISLDQNISLKPQNINLSKLSVPSPNHILSNRPDILAAEKKALAAGLNLEVARKNFLPSIALTGAPGSRSDEFESLLDKNFQTWGINGSLTQPIFNGGRLRATHRQAKALRESAWAQYRATALRAFVEVENLMAAEVRLTEEEKYIEAAARSAEQASRLSWERYQRGVEGIFNALENQRRAFDARSRALSLRKQRIHNRIDLYLALGISPLA